MSVKKVDVTRMSFSITVCSHSFQTLRREFIIAKKALQPFRIHKGSGLSGSSLEALAVLMQVVQKQRYSMGILMRKKLLHTICTRVKREVRILVKIYDPPSEGNSCHLNKY